jgi:hypothetical protein
MQTLLSLSLFYHSGKLTTLDWDFRFLTNRQLLKREKLEFIKMFQGLTLLPKIQPSLLLLFPV